MPESFIFIGSELIVQAGLEFLIFHELGHIISGNYSVDRSGWLRTPGQKAMEMEADLFAAERLAESLYSRQLQIMTARKEWNQIGDSYFSALCVMGVFAVFALMAYEEQTIASDYPPFDVRINGFCNELCIGLDERSRTGKGMFEAIGLIRFASVGFPMVLRELGMDKPEYVQALSQYSVFRGRVITDENIVEVQRWMQHVGTAVGPYVSGLNGLRPTYASKRNRRVEREVWDSNW